MNYIKNKVVVIGAGMVGSAVISSLLNLDMVAEIAVIDSNKKKAIGESLDASHTTSFEYSPNVNVHEGDYSECKDSQIIIITAGPSGKPGDNTDRMAVDGINVDVVCQVMENISKYTKEAIILIVTNPVDIVTYVAQKKFNYPKNKIIGTGTLLDTGRFRRILAKKYLVDTKNVSGFILGEHGESAFATWSTTSIAGIKANRFDDILVSDEKLDKEKIIDEVVNVGRWILDMKGYTNFGIATSVSRFVKAILLNELSILPASTTLEGEYNIHDVALSIPCQIGSQGIIRTVEIDLTSDELEKLNKSSNKLKAALNKLNLK